jgi:hypothetical protein
VTIVVSWGLSSEEGNVPPSVIGSYEIVRKINVCGVDSSIDTGNDRASTVISTGKSPGRGGLDVFNSPLGKNTGLAGGLSFNVMRDDGDFELLRDFSYGWKSGQFGDEDGIRVTNVDLVGDPEDFVSDGGRVEQGTSFGLSLDRVGAKSVGNSGSSGTSGGESGLLKSGKNWACRSWEGDENVCR